jgi:hypothetical protein
MDEPVEIALERIHVEQQGRCVDLLDCHTDGCRWR